MLTERKIQTILSNEFIHRRKHKVSIPNVYLYNWESDLLTINRNDYITEYEIKCSRHDYLNDFKKEKKHQEIKLMNNCSAIPNYFYYACPDGLINVEDIPEYAGLIYIKKYRMYLPNVVKRAPQLHKINFHRWEEIAIKLSYKLLDNQ